MGTYKTNNEPKYIIQPDRHSCGPVAILNLLEWGSLVAKPRVIQRGNCYHNSSLKTNKPLYTFNELVKMCKCKAPGGTQFDAFHRTITTVCSKTDITLEQIIFKPTYNQVCSHLDNGYAIILLFHWKDDYSSGEHFCLLSRADTTRHTGKQFRFINSDNPIANRPIIEDINSADLKKYLMPCVYEPDTHFMDINDCVYPKAFVFSVSTSAPNLDAMKNRCRDSKKTGKRKRSWAL